MAAIEPAGIDTEEPFHARDQIALRRLDDRVKMIAHEAVGVDLPRGFAARLAERGEKATAVVVIAEDGLAMIAPVHHMVDRTRIFHSELAGHVASCARPAKCVNTID